LPMIVIGAVFLFAAIRNGKHTSESPQVSPAN
jgi:hypothetical protein